ncbi:MAG: hypothetical protein WAN11_08655 [Syntrophobacteraceae bacterium]
MTFYQIKRLIHLHERVERHLSAYSRLSTDLSTQSKGLRHLRKAARLYFQIADLIRDSTSVTAYTGKGNFLVDTHPHL